MGNGKWADTEDDYAAICGQVAAGRVGRVVRARARGHLRIGQEDKWAMGGAVDVDRGAPDVAG